MKRTIGSLAILGIAGVALALAQKQPQPKSQGELEAIQAMFGAPDADARIKAAEQLIVKYADTEFKPLALYFIAASYEQKGDVEKMIVYAERALEADPTDFKPMLMLANGIARRTREFDLDREEKLNRAEKMAKDAIVAIKAAPKPNPQLPDDQWDAAKRDYEAQAHEAIGVGMMVRKKYAEAAAAFATSISAASAPDPATFVRLAQAQTMAGKPDEALATLEKLNALPDVHPQIKQAAQAERVRATQAKSANAPQ